MIILTQILSSLWTKLIIDGNRKCEKLSRLSNNVIITIVQSVCVTDWCIKSDKRLSYLFESHSFERRLSSDPQRCGGGGGWASRDGVHSPQRPPWTHHLLEEEQCPGQRPRWEDYGKLDTFLQTTSSSQIPEIPFISLQTDFKTIQNYILYCC